MHFVVQTGPFIALIFEEMYIVLHLCNISGITFVKPFKPADMRKKSWIILGFCAVLLTTTILLAGTPTPVSASGDTACCKMKSQEECLKKQKGNNPGGIIIDNLSHQFMLIGTF